MYESEKDLFRLRDSYIQELKNLKLKLGELTQIRGSLNKPPYDLGGKISRASVTFHPQIEHIDVRGKISRKSLNPNDGPPGGRAKPYQFELINNEWKITTN